MSHARSEQKNFKALAPDAYDIVAALGQAAAKAGIDKQLLELIKLRASQINGCAFCVQYHILQGESLGISADKLNLLVVWREAPVFSSRERGAGVDRSADAPRRGRQRRSLCRGSCGIFRGGTGLSHFRGRFDQRLEQAGGRLSLDPSGAAKNRRCGVVKLSCRRLPACRDGRRPLARHAPRQAKWRLRVRSRAHVRGSNARRPRSE
jgi:AhpD family alkylhydroperoxidase